MSPQELSRRHNLDPEQMAEEIASHRGDMIPEPTVRTTKNGDGGTDGDDDEEDDIEEEDNDV